MEERATGGDPTTAAEAGGRTGQRRSFAVRATIAAAIAIGLVALVYLLGKLTTVLLLLFAAILLAVFIEGLADMLVERAGMSRLPAIAVVIVTLLILIVGFWALAGPRIAEQATQLGDRVQEAVQSGRAYLQDREWGRRLIASVSDPSALMPSAGGIAGGVSGVFSTVLGAVTNILLVLVLGLYLVISPSLYVDNALRLVPRERRDRGREIVGALQTALGWWLVGRFASMAVVGVLTVIGLLIAGIPLAFVLGVIAALFSFVPLIGPIASFFPAALVAWSDSPIKVLYTLIVFVAVQLLESNLITPVIEHRAVSIPPALLLAAQMIMGTFFGILGVLVATPVAVVVIVLVQTLYVEDVLGEEAKLLGER